jgi:hypothetical protein
MDEAKTMKSNTQLFFSSKVTDLNAINIQNVTKDYTLMSRFNEYKKNLIDQAITDNTKVNMGICDYVLGEMNTIYNTP